jgi:hypothetical protein
MTSQIARSKFEENYSNFQKLNFEAYYRERVGTLSLIELRPKVNDLAEKFELVKKSYDYINDGLLKQATNTLTTFNSHVLTTSNYADAIYTQQRHQIEGQFLSIYEQSFAWWSLIAGLISVNINDSERESILEESRKIAEEIKNQKDSSKQYLEEISNLKNQLEERLSYVDAKYRELTPKSEFYSKGTFFEIEADKNKRNSYLWAAIILIVTVVFVVVLREIVLNFCFEMKCLDPCKLNIYNESCADCGKILFYFEILKAVLFRILIISLLIFMLSFSIKNYNANRHNYTINKHKSNSFFAVLALLETVSGEGRDKLVLNAANSIFTHQNTGYLNKESDLINSNVIEKLIDKIK